MGAVTGAPPPAPAADAPTGPGAPPTSRARGPRRALRRTGAALLALGAVAAIAGAALAVLQPPLPWLDSDGALGHGGLVIRDIDPDDTVAGPLLLVALASGADPQAVVADAAPDAIDVGELTADGLLPLAFPDEESRAQAAERLAAHEGVRLVHEPADLDPGGLR